MNTLSNVYVKSSCHISHIITDSISMIAFSQIRRLRGSNYGEVVGNVKSRVNAITMNHTQKKMAVSCWNTLFAVTVYWLCKPPIVAWCDPSTHIFQGFYLLGTTKNFRPNARDPPRTRLNNTTSQFSLPSTGDPCIIHKNKNGPVESECKLNNVNPHIIRNQIQNQIEVTLNEHRYCKLCHYQTNTEF